MTKKPSSGVAELVHRAQSDVPTREHRYVYGDSSAPSAPRYVVRPNKKVVGRKVSTFSIILLLFGFSLATVSYIGNIIAVNGLAAEVNQLQAQYDKLMNSNAVLKAEISRKSGWERIGKIASEQVGLRYLKEQPTMFDVDDDIVEQAREKLQTK